MGQKKRQIQYDYLRALAVFCIILVHSIPAETLNTNQWLFAASLRPVLLTFVGIFFMLSGLFLLDSGVEDIPGFYRKRLRSIFVPFVFYSLIYYWYYKVYLGKDGLLWWEHIGAFFKDIVTANIPMAPHLWFMYVLMSLYLCAPFLSRMLKNLNDRELKIFLVLILLVQGIYIYLPALGLDIQENLHYMLFKGWFIYFVLGYICKRLYGKCRYLPFAILGIGGFGITMFQKCLTPWFAPGIHDLAYTMIAMTAAIFLFFEYYGNIRIPVLSGIAGFVCRYSYSVYLIHYLVLGQFVDKWVDKTVIRHYYLPKIACRSVLTFLVSLGVSFLLDETIVKFLKKAIKDKRRQGFEKQL